MPFLAPIFIALALFIEFHAVLATFIFGLAASMTLSAVSRLLTPKPKFSGLSSTGSQVTLRQPIASWRVIYGTVRVGGIITYVQVTGANGEYLHLVITLAGHKVHSIGTMYFDGVAATEDGTFVFVERNLGTDTQAAFADMVAKSGGKWTSAYQQKGRAGVHVRLKWDQNKFPNGVPNITFDMEGKELYDPRTLTEVFSHNAALALADYLTQTDYGLAVRSRKATRIQTSGGSSTLKYDFDAGVSANGVVYEDLVFVENIGVNDVIVETTTAGTPQSVTVPPGTVKNVYLQWTGNGVNDVHLSFHAASSGLALDFLAYNPVIRRLGIDEDLVASASKLFSGSGWAAGSGATVTVTQNHLASIELDRAQLIAVANTCDEDVALKAGGTEKRYACNGSFDTSTLVRENIQSLLTAMAGRLTYLNAIYNIFAGQFLTPTETIGDGDLRDAITVQTTRSKRDMFNGVKGLFVSPVNQWQPTDFPPYQNLSYVSRDGEELWKDVQLPFTTSVATAQRLAKIDLERIRRQIQVVFKCKLKKWTIAPLDVIEVSNQRFGWVNKTFEVVSVNLAFENQEKAGPIIGVDITAVETDSAVYAWNAATEEGVGEVTGTPTLPTNVPLPVTAVTLASGDTNSLVVDGVRYARLKVSWTLPADQFVLSGGFHDVYYRIVGAGAWTHHGRFDGVIDNVLIGNVAVGSSYEAFVRSTNVNGVSADSSTSSSHTVTITLAGTVSGAAMRPYRPLSNPLTAHDAGSNITISIAAFTMRIEGFGDVAYNSGSITALSYNTLYYIYYDDATAVGGTVSFIAATVKEDTLNNGARFFLGSIQTPRAGAQDTVGNNDGGGGSKVGMVTVLGMTSVTPFNSGTGSSVSNPQRSFDGDMTTKSTLTILGNGTDGHASLLWTAPPGILRNYTSAVLKIRRALTTNALGGSVGNPTYTLKYYVQGTGSFTNIETANNNTTLALGVASVTLPPNINLATVTVGINIDGGTGATSGSIVLDVYEVWIEVTE